MHTHAHDGYMHQPHRLYVSASLINEVATCISLIDYILYQLASSMRLMHVAIPMMCVCSLSPCCLLFFNIEFEKLGVAWEQD